MMYYQERSYLGGPTCKDAAAAAAVAGMASMPHSAAVILLYMRYVYTDNCLSDCVLACNAETL